MEYIPENSLLQFHPDTLQHIRKLYNLDKLGAMDEAIDIFEMWVKKQQHFTKKDFSRDYLERIIIRAKGSVERAKERLDKVCTTRTLAPHFFNDLYPRHPLLANVEDVFLPKLTKDYYRVYLGLDKVKDYTPEFFNVYYRRLISMTEYVCKNDYPCGVIIILDFRPTSLFELIKYMNISDMGHVLNLILTGCGFRLKGFYIMTESKFADTLLSIYKQVVSKKIADRIQVIKTNEELHNYVDRDILPNDYGGKEISRIEIHKKWLDVLDSAEFNAFITDLYQAKTIEKLRIKDGVKDEQFGIPGTFRALNMD